jgi:ectoine hydroxylase-related dioxygenase (phytanoyl-CoA dioxygenase family)
MSLWIDESDALGRLDSVDPSHAGHVRQLIEDGLTVLRRAVSPELCDRATADFVRYCDEHPESTDFTDDHGHHSRLCSFHFASVPMLAIGLQPEILRFLDSMFEAPAAIATSLFFERGSQQDIHRDSPHFHTNPEGRFFGVWTALEDLSSDNGPLSYYVGGHKVTVDRFEVRDSMPSASPLEMYLLEYQPQVVAACKEKGLDLVEAVDINKGDVVVWHPQLPHGGAPVRNAALSRRSTVFHYLPAGHQMRGSDVFFSDSYPTGQLPTLSVAGREMFDLGSPIFAPDI